MLGPSRVGNYAWPTSLRGVSGKWGCAEREWALLSEIPQGSNGGHPDHLILHLQTDRSCLSGVTAQYENAEDLHTLLFSADDFKLKRNHGGRDSPLPV